MYCSSTRKLANVARQVRTKFLSCLSSSNSVRQRLKPSLGQLLVACIIRVNTIASHCISVESSPCIHNRYRAVCSRLTCCPRLDHVVQSYDAWPTFGAVGRIHWDDLRGEDFHGRFRSAHLVYELAECGGDFLGRAVAPNVVRTEMHHNDVGFSGRKPTR
jgi:hypothetical protein